MKKIRNIFISLALILTLLPYTAAFAAVGSVRLDGSDFENYTTTTTPSGFLGTLNDGRTYSEYSDDEHGTSVRFDADKPSSSPWMGFIYREVTGGLIKVELDFMPISEKFTSNLVQIQSVEGVFFTILSTSVSGEFTYLATTNAENATRHKKYVAGTWYHIEAIVNLDNDTFSFSINGDEIAKDASHGKVNYKNFRSARLSANMAATNGLVGSMYIDNYFLSRVFDAPEVTSAQFDEKDLKITFNKDMDAASFANNVGLYVGNQRVEATFTGSYQNKVYTISNITPFKENMKYIVTFDGVRCVDGGEPESITVKSPLTDVGITRAEFSSNSQSIDSAADIDGGVSATADIENCGPSNKEVYAVLGLYEGDMLLGYDYTPVTVPANDSTQVNLSVNKEGDGAVLYLLNRELKPIGEEIILSGSALTASERKTPIEGTPFARIAYNMTEGTVRVSGKHTAGEAVSLLSCLVAETDYFSNTVAITQTTVYENGYYEMIFKNNLSFLSDSYRVVVTAGNKQETLFYNFSNPIEVIDALAEANDAKTTTDIQGLVEKYDKVFGLELTEYNTINKENAESLILKERPAGGYTGAADFYNVFNKAVCVTLINQKKNTVDVIAKYETLFGFEGGRFAALPDVDFARAILENSTYTTFDAFVSGYETAEMLCLISNSAKTADLKRYITETYADEIKPFSDAGILTKYNAIKEKNAVFNILIKQDFTDVNLLKAAFEDAVNDVYKSENSNNKQQSGSVGSSRGGFSSVNEVVAPPVEKALSPLVSYPDIGDAVWAQESILGLSAMGVVSGDDTGKFRPNDELKREEFVKMLVLSFGLLADGADSQFSDIPLGHWSYTYVSSAYKCGIVMGRGDNIFGAGSPVTREEMLTLLYRTACSMGYIKDGDVITPYLYSDYTDTSEYARDAVNYMSNIDMVIGVTDGNLYAKNPSTRAETAETLWRFLQLIQGGKAS